MAPLDELRQRAAALRARAATLAATGKPLRFRDDRYGLRYLASVDTYPGGLGFRVTTFDSAGPIGHREHRTLEAAVLELLQGGATLEGEP